MGRQETQVRVDCQKFREFCQTMGRAWIIRHDGFYLESDSLSHYA